MTTPKNFARAQFTPQSGKNKGEKIPVHFNPVSLQYTITNTLKEQGQGNSKKQHVSQSTGKLTMDLIFDTTDKGEDVRLYTEKVSRFMEPDAKKVPPIVLFEWGLYKFQGMVESYKETIDFFSANGVPLRAAVNLTLSRQDKVFEPSKTSGTADTQSSLQPEPIQVLNRARRDATSTGAQGGDPRAGRGIAASNGLESMRFPGGVALTVGDSIQLGGPVAFATGGAGGALSIGGGISGGIGGGVGISGGIGGSISAGAGFSVGGSAGAVASAGVGAGFSAGGGINAGASFSTNAGVTGGTSAGFSVGGSASAGISASAGAFAELRSSSQGSSFRLDTSRYIERSESVSLATDSGASFQVGGQAVIEGSSSLRADVGASASLQSRIQFQEV